MRTELESGTPAIVARPRGQPSRTLVLVPDLGGLRELFDGLADHLAAQHGWVVVMPEIWVGREHLSTEERLASVGGLDDSRLGDDCRAAATLGGVAPAAVAGFCMGGMIALKAAAGGGFDKAVSFYGMVHLPEHWQTPTMADTLRVLRSAPVPVEALCVAGTADPWIAASDLDELEEIGVRVVRYPDADHGFAHDPYRPAHRPDDAADAWARVATFLEA